VAAARCRTPSCIFLDVHIPGKSGLDVLKELSAEGFPAPILVMSGQGDIPMAVEAVKCGALDFIEKPLRSADIVARVKAAIGPCSRSHIDDTASEHVALHFPGGSP
jgi:FixJ family two-component response regulator